MTVTAATDTSTTEVTTTFIDPSAVDKEVQRRLDQERARLEERTRTVRPEALPGRPPVADAIRETALRDYVRVPVYYATTRKVDADDRKNVYGGERGIPQFGVSWVSIPHSHQPGELEEPSIRTFTFREDPKKHVMLLSVRALPKDRWFAELNSSILDGRLRQAFVFIHGYNVTFSEACRRTAQIKYDLGFRGAAILYSWPSLGEESMYLADEANAEWSAPRLAAFLIELRKRTGATTIHIIAHSMGNRVLSRAMERIDLDTNVTPKPTFNQVMLAAPDMDAEVFREELAQRMLKLADGITLYGSSDDRAILASRKVHQTPRAGEGGPSLPIIPGIESIDVTGMDASFLAHSYIGSVCVLGDIAQMICDGKRPADRLGIAKRVPAGWRLIASSKKRTPRPCRPAT